MTSNNDSDIYRLFDNVREPEPDDVFVESITNKVKQLNQLQRMKKYGLVFAVLVLAGVLTPWIVEVTSILTRGTVYMTNIVAAYAVSPIGWVIIAGVLFPVLILLRYYSNKTQNRVFEIINSL